jgi:hypothetical protein
MNFLHRRYCVIAGLRIAGTVGQEHAVRFQRQHFGGAGLGRYHSNAATALGQHAQDVALHAKVVCHHMEFGFGAVAMPFAKLPNALFPFVGFVAGNHLRQVHTSQTGKSTRGSQRRFHIISRGDAAVLSAFGTQDTRQLARVDAGDGDHVVGLKVFG